MFGLLKRKGGRSRLLVVGVVVILGLGAWLGYQAWLGSQAPSVLIGSGTLEADETLLSPQVTGAITALPFPEGSAVSKGAVVARIDDRVIQLQREQAISTDVATERVLALEADEYVLRAPVDGIVTRVPTHVGEMAMPGETLLAIANLASLKLTVYVREADLAKVAVGQTLSVTADPFPNRSFTGRVTSINQRAEFTPRNIQTQADRLNLVFGVQTLVANPEGALKPGMPVDVRFAPGSGG
jgi:multidrug resistance efflux pump